MRILDSKHDGQTLVSNAARFITEVELLLAQMKCNPLVGPGIVDCRNYKSHSMTACLRSALAGLPAQNCIGFQDSHILSEGLGSDFRRLEVETAFVLRDFFAVRRLAMVVRRYESVWKPCAEAAPDRSTRSYIGRYCNRHSTKR